MNRNTLGQAALSIGPTPYAAAGEYLLDTWQRGILFWDVLRKRGNNYLEHIEEGQPPVLVFAYEMVVDARTLEQPANYALVHIVNRRCCEGERRHEPREGAGFRRKAGPTGDQGPIDPYRRPIVIIDPRAGHGPGIGGSKLNSQIGVALDHGHPVYFVMFYTNPEPGQTLADVHRAEILFLEEVARRHPKAPKPAVIGNCQAGWATALIGADRPDVTGPMVLNGSPLSYWGGVEGANPMRYRGGLCGGAWLTSLWCDLGNGRFDGANLVAGFEDLNPSNTLWSKLYHLYANVDTEEERFLTFEKWWGGFFKMNAAEIHFIVEKLFIGNSLEQGRLELSNGETIDLKNITDPILVFASGGDNITPPPQALGWIKKVYGSVEEIKRNRQVIVYMVHQEVGHLGIFVSGSVARKQHKEIIGCLEMLEYLAPGLYEMVIEGDPSQPGLDDYLVGFEEREMEDLLDLDDGVEDEAAFETVATVSRFQDGLYRSWISPWVRAGVNEGVAETIRLLHPLRVQRYALSDRNPWLAPLKWVAPWVRRARRPAADENPFAAAERLASAAAVAGLDGWRDLRDRSQEVLFNWVYGNPWTKLWADTVSRVHGHEDQTGGDETYVPPRRPSPAAEEYTAGGFAEALVRTLLAVALANHTLDRRQFEVAQEITRVDQRLRGIRPAEFKQLVREQWRLLEADPQRALEGLSSLLPEPGDRVEVYEAARRIAVADRELETVESSLLAEIRRVLGLDMPASGEGNRSRS